MYKYSQELFDSDWFQDEDGKLFIDHDLADSDQLDEFHSNGIGLIRIDDTYKRFNESKGYFVG